MGRRWKGRRVGGLGLPVKQRGLEMEVSGDVDGCRQRSSKRWSEEVHCRSWILVHLFVRCI